MKDLVLYIAKSIVNNPDDVRIQQVRGRNTAILKLRVHPDDKGWVIGRHGRVANAMRSLLRASGDSEDRRVILEIE